MTQYEYLVQAVGYGKEFDLKLDEAGLNHHGKDGWELVSVLGPTKTKDQGRALIYYFRRPLQQPA